MTWVRYESRSIGCVSEIVRYKKGSALKVGSSVAKMLHGLKVAMHGRNEKTVLGTDARLQEAGRKLCILQAQFPGLEAAVEENERMWARLGFSIRSVARAAQESYPGVHAMQFVLDRLHVAGERIVPPGKGEGLHEERGRVFGELRVFNEGIRRLRGLHVGCVGALKELEYYRGKVEGIRVAEGRKRKVTEKDVERRLRNEVKLREVGAGLRFKWERLERELEEIELREEGVLDSVVWCFVHSQEWFFGRNGIQEVIAVAERGSPRGIVDYGKFASDVIASDNDPLNDNYQLPTPPRPPSPSGLPNLSGPVEMIIDNNNI